MKIHIKNSEYAISYTHNQNDPQRSALKKKHSTCYLSWKKDEWEGLKET